MRQARCGQMHPLSLPLLLPLPIFSLRPQTTWEQVPDLESTQAGRHITSSTGMQGSEQQLMGTLGKPSEGLPSEPEPWACKGRREPCHPLLPQTPRTCRGSPRAADSRPLGNEKYGASCRLAAQAALTNATPAACTTHIHFLWFW